MKITEVCIDGLGSIGSKEPLAYLSLVFDDVFVVHDVRVVYRNDKLILAMPDRKARFPCEACGFKVIYSSHYCGNCGKKFSFVADSETKLHPNVANPIDADFRRYVERVSFALVRRALLEDGRFRDASVLPDADDVRPEDPALTRSVRT